VFGLINNHLWPVKALETARAKLASALRGLAKLAGLPDESKDPAPRLAEAYDLRLQTYQDFGAVRQLLAGAKFEPGEAVRRKLEEIAATAQKLLVYLLAITQHRLDLRPEAVPEPLRAAAARFKTTLADVLQVLGDRMMGKDRPMQELEGALIELEQTVAAQINAVADAGLVAQIRARLALYQEAVPIVLQLARRQAG